MPPYVYMNLSTNVDYMNPFNAYVFNVRIIVYREYILAHLNITTGNIEEQENYWDDTYKLPQLIEARFVRLTIVSFVEFPILKWAIEGCDMSILSIFD